MQRLSTIVTKATLAVGFCLLVAVTNAQAATLTVTKTADTNDGVCDADCSLREAIAVAAAGDTILFAGPLFDSPQVITLSEAVGFQELFIDKDLTITGKGSNLLTIRRAPTASAKFRVIDIQSVEYPSINLSGMTITGGDVSGNDGEAGIGGGIHSYGGYLTLTNCVVTANAANSAGGIHSRNNNDLTISNSTISNNTATATVAGGAGIEKGGGGTLTMTNSTVSGNVKINADVYSGGGIHVSGADALITNSTITDNGTAGISGAGGILKMSGTVTIRNSIVAGNRNNTSTPDVYPAPFGGSIVSGGYNIIGNRSFITAFNQTGDQTGTAASPLDPRLYSLGNYGGQTPTHALRSDSPAIDKGNSFGSTTDQRGVARPYDDPNTAGTGPDIGAFELLPIVTNTNDSGTGSLRQVIADVPPNGVVMFDPDFFGATARTITLTTSDLTINKSLTIAGSGANLLIVQRSLAGGTQRFRIFTINAGLTVNLNGMTITGGNVSSSDGGGIFSSGSTTTITGCHITGNTAVDGGGGIRNINNGTLVILNSTISNNVSNSTNDGGGGIYNSGTLTVINSTISGNAKNSGNHNGGGIFLSSGTVTITNSTITDNDASGPNSGGGIFRQGGAVTIRNSIVAANRSNATIPDVVGAFTSAGFNLIGNVGAATGFNQTGDQTGTGAAVLNPLLSALALNNGPTPTHRLQTGSPALDKGNSFGSSTDQRGFGRPVDITSVANATGGDASDIGAYELQAPLAYPDSYTTDEDVQLIVNAPGVLANDINPEGGPLTITVLSGPHLGFVFMHDDGSFTYTLLPNFNGTDSFTYKVNNGQSDSNIVTVTITINSVNDLPVALDDSYDLRPNTAKVVPAPGVLQNDTDVESPLTANLVSNPTHGSLALNSDGSFIYTPAANYLGTDSFTYKANDGTADSPVATVNILVNFPAQWTVTKTADTNDGVCDSDCSLREAIAVAAGGDEIVFASPLFDSAQAITLVNGSGFNDLVVNKSLTITGRGANLLTIKRVNPNPNPPPEQKFRIFNVTGSGVIANLSGMTMTGGFPNVFFSGGAINNNNGSTLTVSGCYINNNQSTNFGGGISNDSFSTLTVVNSTISNNQAGGGPGGGGIDNRGTLVVSNSTVSGNHKVFSNVASDNAAGGIYSSGSALITSSTIVNNDSVGSGSARNIYNNGTLTIRNTIAVNINTSPSLPDTAGNAFTSLGYNLISNVGTATGFNQSGDQTGTSSSQINGRLDTLANYGGPTPTHRLQANSPAMDKGKSFGLTSDQRGNQRPADNSSIANAPGGDGADIGAFEVPLAPTAAPASISGQITTADGSPLPGVMVQLSGGGSQTTITDSSGSYAFSDLESGSFYTVTPLLVNFSFNPQMRSLSLLAKADAVFTAVPNGMLTANLLDTSSFFVRQQYLDFLGREPDQGGLQYWTNQIDQCNGDAACLHRQRISVSAAFFIEQEAQQTGSFIYDIYAATLSRHPAFAEYTSDRQAVAGGSDLDAEKASFAQSFAQRSEFIARYGSNMTAQSLVDALVENVRLSGVDLSGRRDALISVYNSGDNLVQSRGLVLLAIADDAEFKQAQYNAAFVLAEYFGYLRRNPDQSGYDFWLNVLNNSAGDSGNYRGMVCSFITSTEYQLRFTSVVTHSNGECGHN